MGDDGGGGGGSDAGAVTAGDSSTPATPAPSPVPALALYTQSCSAKSGPAVDFSPMRRISRVEYNNMVHDLLGDTTQPANGFAGESPMASGVNFQVNTYNTVSTTIVQQYLFAAEALGQAAFDNASNQLQNTVFTGISSCGGLAQTDACATDFIASWVNRAYRGQLDSTESSGLFTLYSMTKAQFDWKSGIQAVITAVLESPRFLYVMEFGNGNPAGSVVPLAPYEIATRLALLLWRSVPDAKLMTDAQQGLLATPAGLVAEAQRMIADSKAQGALDDFTAQWIELTGIQAKDTQYTAFNGDAQLASEMYAETQLNFSQLVLGGGGLGELLTTPSSYVNQDLAHFYGVSQGSGPSVNANSGGQYVKTTLPNRAGILTNAGVLATQAHSTLPSFVLRGKLVREDLLCDPIPPPPPNIPAAPTAPPDAGTTRDLLLAHQQRGTNCPGCHQYMDSIGEGFGNFDATGAYQATDDNGTHDAGRPRIDPSGSVQAMPGDTGGLQATYKDAVDLATQLSTATQVRQCFALQEMRYALGRRETADDACSLQQIYSAFSANNFNIQQLLLAVIQSDAFRYRSAGSACQ